MDNLKSLLLTLGLTFIVSASFADTFTVCSSSDDGPGSFRQATLDANANPGSDTINFSASLDGIPIEVSSGACVITESITILGRGIANTILDGFSTSGIITSSTDGASTELRKLTMQNATNQAVYYDADVALDVRYCQFQSNSTLTEDGACIWYSSSTDSAYIDHCIFDSNSAFQGAAINHQGSYMLILNSTFSNNAASENGGAMKLSGDITEITNCTFSGNTAQYGGAIKDFNLTPGSYFLNCTFTDNNATLEGGAFHTGTDIIFNTKFSMYNCIVYGNTAPQGNDIWNGFGFTGTYEFNIVGDCYSDASTCPVWFSTADPLLDAAGLEDNGGFTQTVDLMVGSPAIDNGLSVGIAASFTDQRDKGRCPTPDIGALETNTALGAPAAFSITECTEYTVPSGKATYSTSGVYMDTIPAVNGCDSVLTITLTITAPTTNSIVENVCGSYTVPSGDETYFCSGVYTDTIPNAALCDSIITINLTVTPHSTSSIFEFDCSSYTVPSGDETYTTSGVYYDTIPAASGCDSVISIALTIGDNNSFYAVVSCDSYTVPSGDETYFVSGVHSDTIPNSAGCDSVMLITMTILNSTTFSYSVSQCNPYTVPSGDETYTNSGIYMDTIPNAIGCDSILTIDLTINYLDTNIVDSVCHSYTVPSGEETYYASGIVTDTIPGSGGCDSIITIDLTILNAYTGMSISGSTYTALATPATYQWVSCPGMTPLPGETNQTFTAPPEGGTFAVIVTEFGCADTSICYNINSIGLNESEQLEFSLYPNPASGRFNIQLNQFYQDLEVSMYDGRGRLVHRESFQDTDYIDIHPKLESGIYSVLIAGDLSISKAVKLIIE